MDLLQILLVVVGAVCAGYLIWCLIRATRYMRNHPDEFGCLAITVLLMLSVQPVMADDDQPRFMIPNLDVQNKELYGYAAVTEQNPFFTIYLWYGNSDWDDSYWDTAPTITIDGHSVQLKGLCGNQKENFENFNKDWMCYSGDELYYTIHGHDGFEAKKNKVFYNTYKNCKVFDSHSNFGEDWYVILDVYMRKNVDGAKHEISVSGYCYVDGDYKKTLWCKDENGNTVITSGATICPFEYLNQNTKLTWSSPRKLTYTTASFKQKHWGMYQAVFDGVASEQVDSGVVSITKDYGSATNYQNNAAKKVEYYYDGVYNRIDNKKRTGWATDVLPASKFKTLNLLWAHHWEYDAEHMYRFTEETFDNTVIKANSAYVTFSTDNNSNINKYYFVFDKECTVTMHCLDKKICRVRFLDTAQEIVGTGISDGVVKEYDYIANPQSNISFKLDKKIEATDIEITFDHDPNGYVMTFEGTYYKTPETLPYPMELKTSYDEWDKTATLTWKTGNAKQTGNEGKFLVFRNGEFLDSVAIDKRGKDCSYTNNINYGTDYKYQVTYIPPQWTDSDRDELLTTSVMAKLNRTVSINYAAAKAQNNCYKLDWRISSKVDRAGYKFKIYRKVITADQPNPTISDFAGLDSIHVETIDNPNDMSFSWKDEKIATTETYAYLIKMDNIQDTTLYVGPVIPDGHPGTSQITSLKASRGTYTDHVLLEWTETVVGSDNLNYDIYRHRINEGENDISTIGDAVQLDWIKLASLVSTKDKPVTSYDDKTAKGGYYYVYAVIARPNGSNEVFTRKVIDGFVRSTGTVSGSVTYADKYAVQGVNMLLAASATTNASTLFNALRFKGGKGGIHWNVNPQRYSTYFQKEFSVQMYVRPDGTNESGACLLDMGQQLRLSLSDYDADNGWLITAAADGNTMKTTHRIKADRFTHVTFTYDGKGRCNVYLMAVDSLGSLAADSLDMVLHISNEMQGGIAVAAATDSTQTISGYVDEVRFFKRCLTVADVVQNYNHYMSGVESGLVAYWPFDENISTLRWAYDYSKTESQANENHAAIIGGLRNNIEVPTADQLSLFAVTDTLGRYTLSGIPFVGEGTTYSLVPSKGAHSFKPVSRTLYVSPETLTFKDLDFTDNSSFNVKGVVYYENTTYPVKGCRFRVDDVVVKDEWGKEITSDENGEFTFPVSIGEHAIYIEKEGHTFLHNGRYPAENLHNFNDSISGLTFTDLTKAVVVGRVAGGSKEKNKPMGLGLGNANIGAATLTLFTSNSIEDARRMNVILDSEEGIYNSNPDTLYYEQANPDYVKSKAWVGGTKDGSDAVKRITINTDPKNGEFAVLLPPVPYYVSTVVNNNQEATAYFTGKTMMDCSDVTNPQTVTDGDLSLTYHTAFAQTYFSTPVISVKQSDNSVGAFGDARVPAGELEDSVYTYTVADDGQLTYNYGYPIFTAARFYEFNIEAYERYLNYDANPEYPKEDKQASTEGYLTFTNPMVLTADTVSAAPLDSLGCYTYQFQAIEPNEVAPYTQPIAISLTIGDNVYPWTWKYGDEEGAMQCVVFGTKLTGQTSVTAAPDALVNIIRDPFGTSSNQVWNSGSTNSKGFKAKIEGSFDMGTNIEAGTGAALKGGGISPGLFIYKAIGCAAGNSRGITWKAHIDADGGATWTHTTTEEFSTSAEPIFDGPNGDVFVGMSTSLIYGDGQQVMLVNDQQGGYRIGTQEAVAAANRMETTFTYTQAYIVNDLIPNYKRLREAKLIRVSEGELAANRSSFRNTTDSMIYMTSLTPDDPRFGTCNDDKVWGDQALDDWHLNWSTDSLCYYGPSYTVFLPVSGNYRDEEEMWDAIVTINSNIGLWEDYLTMNERRKVDIFRKDPMRNYSFDTGSPITFTHEKDLTSAGEGTLTTSSSRFHKFGCGVGKGKKRKRTGSFDIDIELTGGGTLSGSEGEKTTYTVNLVDNTADNAHEVAMYDGDSYGYIFRQESGQTSCYYEGEERTKYYEPGTHILSNATVQVQVPQIDCGQPEVMGVPAGEPAVFDLKLSNASVANLTEIQNYHLLVVKDKWGEMAEVSINGQPGVNEFEVALGPGESYDVMVKVTPASSNVIKIDSLCLSLYSDCQWQLSDEIWLKAHFQPKAEPVTLEAWPTTVNTATDTTVVLTAYGYNANSKILKGVRLQQRKAGAPEWTTIHSWVTDTPAGDTESALPAERIDTVVDMHSSIFYPDAAYQFRAVTDCTVSDELVQGESNICTVTKDVTLPKPIQLPEPADGVLNEGDNISVTFNEDIASQSLNKVDHFIIQSVLNTDSVAHDVALRLDGAATPAATSQSGLTLSGTSFTLCSWVKSGGKAGTLFRHGVGQNAFRVGISDDGRLTANIRDVNGVAQTYTSMHPLPKDSWSYVAVVYDVDKGTLSAYYASGDNEATLMTDVPVGKNSLSEGNIYLGEGLTGAMHELSLYSAALTWTTVKAQMYLGKSNTTPALIGYWRLDEGHGDESEDRARGRHMILASKNHWYLENANISMNLDGENYAAIPMGQLSTTEGASYLVEMWVMANYVQNDDAQLLSLDNGKKLDLNLNKGKLQLVADSTVYATSSSINDHQWHHVALNVLKGGSGQANLMVDGVSVLTVASDRVPALAGAKLWLGKNMKGAMDEVRLWHGANTQETINDRMYYRMDGSKEESLVGYWPMEETYYDEYNQRVFAFSMENKGYLGMEATLVPNTEGAIITEGSDAPGLKMAPHKSNLDFDFVADERTVAVTLEHSAEALEGCTVSTTLRDYYDKHDNVGTPITWSFVVKQNALSWNTAEVTPTVTAGYNGTFTATLTNNGVADQTWSFTELPSWLEASPLSGTIFAHGSKEITFTAKQGNPIGKYFTTVSARGNKGLDTPLDICLTVEGKKPNWTPTQYGQRMQIVGQIKIDGVVSTDPDDMVGAFVGISGEQVGECVGVGSPKYNSGRDAYYVSLTVYGTDEMANQEIYFRIYDASTGKTYPLTNVSKKVLFAVNGVMGNYADPVIWENSDKLLQLVDLQMPENGDGIHWISFYLDTDNQNIEQLFKPVSSNIVQVSTNSKTTYTYNGQEWSTQSTPVINAGQMMMVKMSANDTLPVIGYAVNPKDYLYNIVPDSANWLGVPSDSYMTVEEAFAGLHPVDGDVVSGQVAFAMYDSNHWEGDLEAIEPGKGYVYISMDSEAKQFRFPSDPSTKGIGQWQGKKGILANFKYGHNMIVVCTIHDGFDLPVLVDSIRAYDANGELRGITARCFRDSIYVIIISGDTDGEPIHIRPSVNGNGSAASPGHRSAADEEFILQFRKDKILGRLKSPIVLQLGGAATDISEFYRNANSRLTVYNTLGNRVYSGRAADFDRHKLPDHAVYIITEETTDGRIISYKRLNK